MRHFLASPSCCTQNTGHTPRITCLHICLMFHTLTLTHAYSPTVINTLTFKLTPANLHAPTQPARVNSHTLLLAHQHHAPPTLTSLLNTLPPAAAAAAAVGVLSPLPCGRFCWPAVKLLLLLPSVPAATPRLLLRLLKKPGCSAGASRRFERDMARPKERAPTGPLRAWESRPGCVYCCWRWWWWW